MSRSGWTLVLDDAGLRQPAEEVSGCRREPCGHVEIEGSGQLVCVREALAIQTVALALHGVDDQEGGVMVVVVVAVMVMVFIVAV
ncbi:MAG: hypothetical protein ABSE28_19375 [Candidatus Sulfotelmatobacter sp.]